MAILAMAVLLVACAPEDDTTGSRLTQPPAGTPRQQPTDAGDIAIVGEDVAHSIMNLPAVSGASVPPLVRFTGVTSIINPPIDTDPYTQLLRDRLILVTREKLRFIERTLPPYVPPEKKGKHHAEAPAPEMEPDYEILAEMRGRPDDDFYKIQVEFVDIHSGEVLFNGLYRIRHEAESEPSEPPAPAENPPPPAPDNSAPPSPETTPTTTTPAPPLQ